MRSADNRPVLLAHARLIDPVAGTETHGGVLIDNGVVRDLGPAVQPSAMSEATEIHDCRGLVIIPGLVDLRAFIGEPGEEHRETFRSASEAAAAGVSPPSSCSPTPLR